MFKNAMVRMAAVLVTVPLAVTCTLAGASVVDEIDLSGMTYDELVELKDRINLAIWESEEWQEVTVPQGLWEVGVDIPAGHWTISCERGEEPSFCSVDWGNEVTDDGRIGFGTRWGTAQIINPESYIYSDGDLTEYNVDLKDGDWVYVDYLGDRAVFTPYAGKPSLGFK